MCLLVRVFFGMRTLTQGAHVFQANLVGCGDTARKCAVIVRGSRGGLTMSRRLCVPIVHCMKFKVEGLKITRRHETFLGIISSTPSHIASPDTLS